MASISKYDDLRKLIYAFSREHDKAIKKYNIDFISTKGTKIPFICLYQIVFTLFKNNSKNLEASDIVLLTLTIVGFLSQENKDEVKKLIDSLKEKKLLGYFKLVKNTIKSLKNLLNIIFKKEGVVIQHIEEGIKYRYAVDALSIAHKYIKIDNIKIKDFSYWYLVDQRNKPSKDLIDYININYYL
jgi:hypothetical protein